MKKEIFHLVLRPTPAPSVNIVLGARSVGHNRVQPHFHDHVKVKHFVQIFWGIRGIGVVVINNKERPVRPGQIAVYFPGMEHRVFTKGSPWEYCFWTMDGPLAVAIVTAFGLTADVYDVGHAPSNLFRKLEKSILDPSRQGEILASTIAFHLLSLVAGGHQQKDDELVAAAVEFIHCQWNNLQLNVKTLASHLHCHRSTLSRRFRQTTGVSPLEYINRIRMQKALSLLRLSTNSVRSIAEYCGYHDPNYFSRTIRRITGVAPSMFRHNQSHH